MLAGMVSGCAGGGGANDVELIKASIMQWKTGFESKNIDQIMSPVSDKFTHYEWRDKTGLKMFVEGAMAQGELNNAEVDLRYAEYKKNDDGTYTVYPVEVVAVFGSATIEAKFTKEADGVWRITNINVEGV